MYEPIKGDDEEEVKKKKRDDDKVGDVDDDDDDIDIDVEMAVHSRSRASVPNKLEEEKHHRRHQQPPPQSQSQRVVSLDVFRGLTVAVIHFFPPSQFCFTFQSNRINLDWKIMIN